jgi:putative FmdB family regulatory protein
MPLYEYLCKDCGNHFDAIRQIKDADHPIECRQCNSTDTRRMISLFYAQSDGRTVTNTSSGGCSGCSGGSCAGCHH